MSDAVQQITIQISAPKGTFPGKVAIGHYCTADNFVTLCDEAGKPIGDKHILAPGEDRDPSPARCLGGARTRAATPALTISLGIPNCVIERAASSGSATWRGRGALCAVPAFFKIKFCGYSMARKKPDG